MQHLPDTLKTGLRALLLAMPVLAAASPASVPEAVLQCRTVQDLMARLACYDGIALAAPTGRPAAAAAPATPPAVAAPSAPRAPALATAAPPATAATAATVAAPAAAMAPPAVAAFGLPAQPVAEAPAMSSRVQGRFEGWQRGTRLTLANGQVWEVVDNGSAVYDLPSPAVVVKRGLLGSYFIEIEGVSATPRVRRVR